ncbi:MAG: transport-associated protein [Elusimicrobia bacterium GWA2_56_46]|nr:MAG: transport-associated protein [Elusimicrobia bacterium GWA2_56_46]OGR54322.1 MAG: transport-associated protein [Elusimicrobia bacterium GWC2_56_31]HBB66560.1 transport-associated protein [Elusimicrobiota bacterium]HBW22390.1 transport-associated protein [Elusimicrobiota bacterium]
MKTIPRIAIAASLLAVSVSLYASELDSRIESSARKSYVFMTYLKGDDVRVESKDGAVTLTGIVAKNFHQSLAQETVVGLPGVKSVKNMLVVKNSLPSANSDAWLRDRVKITLMFHKSVSAMKTEVKVEEGVVTLGGQAESQAQKELTTEYARDVEGVKDVKNEMTVSMDFKNAPQTAKEKIDDASITAQIRMALLFHRSTSALTTSVSADKGVVTLGGRAGNDAEKALVSKLVEDVNGVKSVKNLMTVDY